MNQQPNKDNHGLPKEFARGEGEIEARIRSTKTRKQVAAEYGIDPYTLKNWIKRSNLEITSGDLSPKSQRLLYAAFGVPPLSAD